MKNIKQEIEYVNSFSDESLRAILKLEKECLPEEWQYPDVDDYYRDILKDKDNVNIFLKENDNIIGYILGRPFNKLADELKEYDSDFKNDNSKFYIETIQILSSSQNKGGSTKLLNAVCEIVLKKGITKFGIHARTVNNFHKKIKKIFEHRICLVRKIEKWVPANNEPYEYIEWSYDYNN